MDLEYETYTILLDLAKNLTPETAASMLDIVEPCVTMAKDTAVYHAALTRFRRGDYPPTDTIEKYIDDLKEIYPNVDYNAIFWLVGLRFAIDTRAFVFVEAQIGTFLAAQKADFFRVTDDKLRLVLTYMYFKLTATLINKDII